MLGTKVVEAFAERLDALGDEVRDKSLAGHTQRTQILQREPVVTGLLACPYFKVGRDLGSPELIEAAGGAAEISRRVDRCVIRADQGDDIADDRRVRAREALFNSDKCEIYRAVEKANRAPRRTHARHRRGERIYFLFRAGRVMKPNLSRLTSNDGNIACDVDPLRDQLRHSITPISE